MIILGHAVGSAGCVIFHFAIRNQPLFIAQKCYFFWFPRTRGRGRHHRINVAARSGAWAAGRRVGAYRDEQMSCWDIHGFPTK